MCCAWSAGLLLSASGLLLVGYLVCCTMELKARGNALFRDGDFRGAANEFRRAIEEGADQVNLLSILKTDPTHQREVALLLPSRNLAACLIIAQIHA